MERERLLERWEERRAATQHDRIDEHPVLVDEPVPDERRRQAGAAGGQRPSGLRLEPRDLARGVLADQPGAPPDIVRVVENTTFCVSFQMRANSRSCSGRD